jgi:hypothetical protein
VFRSDDCVGFESYFRIHDPLLLVDRRAGEAGRVVFRARGLSASHVLRDCCRKARLSPEAFTPDADVAELFPVIPQEIIETAGNKTDANAV